MSLFQNLLPIFTGGTAAKLQTPKLKKAKASRDGEMPLMDAFPGLVPKTGSSGYKAPSVAPFIDRSGFVPPVYFNDPLPAANRVGQMPAQPLVRGNSSVPPGMDIALLLKGLFG